MSFLKTAAVVICVAATGCMVGPDYKRPDAPASPAFKELAGWKPGQPRDNLEKGAWWSIYNDPELDRLERMVEVSNQTVKQFEAQYRNAVALVGEARANLFPTVALNNGVTRAGTGTSVPVTHYTVEGSVSWTLDLWGRVRRQVESNVAGAQMSAADLENAKLSAQATLATDYFDLRAEDSLIILLRQTVEAYSRALKIVQNQYHAGTESNIDVVTAQAQMESAQAQLVGVGVQRHQFEHAIAVLTGHAPSELTIPPAPLTTAVPIVPPGVPSALLERRPDIAAAERQMQAENALIGVQIAAYYPDISLSALGGFDATMLSRLFDVASRVWTLGAAGAETLFSGGARPAAVTAARASYDQYVAVYRQTVLTAFQQVEDALSNSRILEQQAAAEAIAVASARRAVDATLNAYRAGTVAYTSVITEQTLLLSDEQAALAVRQSRLVASVALVEALGGGWTSDTLPAPDKIKRANPIFP